MGDGVAGICGCFILKTAVEVFVGANLFARSSSYVRINSHLHERLNAVNYLSIRFQLRFLGLINGSFDVVSGIEDQRSGLSA